MEQEYDNSAMRAEAVKEPTLMMAYELLENKIRLAEELEQLTDRLCNKFDGLPNDIPTELIADIKQSKSSKKCSNLVQLLELLVRRLERSTEKSYKNTERVISMLG